MEPAPSLREDIHFLMSLFSRPVSPFIVLQHEGSSELSSCLPLIVPSEVSSSVIIAVCHYMVAQRRQPLLLLLLLLLLLSHSSL